MHYQFQKTNDGSFTLLNEKINETYHSQSGAVGEARHVFLAPLVERGFFTDNEVSICGELGRPQGAAPTIHILDVGFGLGVNALCYFDYFLARQSIDETLSLHIVSIENNPDLLNIRYTHEHVGDNKISDEALLFLARYKADRKLVEKNINAELILKNADVALDDLISQNQKFDLVMQDPFSPKNNPECWSAEYFSTLAKVVKKDGVVLSYSVARSVCDALKKAGLSVEKIPGFGQKREQLFAVKL